MSIRHSEDTSETVLFKGVTFTTTDLSAKEKGQIGDAISSMGGRLKSDLTSETNVLIVGSLDTAKSKYCLKHRTDVTLLYPDDLLDIYRRFREKSIPRPTVQILDDYPWPIFDSCLFCLSRLREVENACYEKGYIARLIDHFGGKSIASLTPKVTYLITDKREGKRFESALKWNILPIHPKWIVDSCNCQRILDPSLYDISKIEDVARVGQNSYKKHRNVVDYGRTTDNPLYSKLTGAGPPTKPLKASEKKSLLFQGFIFACFGFDSAQTEKLSHILKTNGSEIQEDYDMSVTHILIPSTFVIDQVPENIRRLKNIADSSIVNEWFIERCLYYKKIMADSWSLPPSNLFLNYDLKIHITGFCDIEHLHLTKLIKNLNLTLRTELTEDCDFLVTNLSSLGLNKSNSPQLFAYKFSDLLVTRTNNTAPAVSLTKRKINSAKKWNIPVVSIAYLWELSQTGVLPHVLDTKWCIFAPRSLRPANNFLEYARSISGGTFTTQVSTDSQILNEGRETQVEVEEQKEEKKANRRSSQEQMSPSKLPVSLPSPRKTSPKKWKKLVGMAPESQLKQADVDDDDYEFKSARRLNFGDHDKNKNHDNFNDRGGNIVEFEQNFGLDDTPMFKKRRL